MGQVAGVPGSGTESTLTNAQRLWAVWTHPRRAFEDLTRRPTVLFPLVLGCLAFALFTAGLYQRAIVPMQLEQMERMVEQGRVPGDALERFENQMRSPMAMGLGVVFGVVPAILIQLLIAGLALFGVTMVLGGSMSFRQAWSLAWWSDLVNLPVLLVTGVLAYFKESLAVHLGLGILFPPEEATTKLGFFLGSLLEGVSLGMVWRLAVLSIGASVMSGKSVKAVVSVYTVFYLVVLLFVAGLSSLFAPVGT